jgi:hypothetical protein
MMYHANNIITSKAKAVFSRVLLGAVIFAASLGSASAAFVTGDMGITGAFTPNDTLDNATLITLTSATGTSGTGDLDNVTFGTPGTIGNGAINLASFSPITDLLTIGGWQLDLSSMSITDQTASVLTLSGGGLLTGNGFDATGATWTFSSNSAGTSYSMTVTASAVPVPAAVWLFGSGLLGLIGIARKKV